MGIRCQATFRWSLWLRFTGFYIRQIRSVFKGIVSLLRNGTGRQVFPIFRFERVIRFPIFFGRSYISGPLEHITEYQPSQLHPVRLCFLRFFQIAIYGGSGELKRTEIMFEQSGYAPALICAPLHPQRTSEPRISPSFIDDPPLSC